MTAHVHYDIAAARAAIERQQADVARAARAAARPEMLPLVEAQNKLTGPSTEVMIAMMQLENDGLAPEIMRMAQVSAAAHYMRLLLQLHDENPLAELMLMKAVEIARDPGSVDRRGFSVGSTFDMPTVQGGRS